MGYFLDGEQQEQDPLGPILPVLTHKHSEYLFEGSVEAFHEVVSLGMVNGGTQWLHPKKRPDVLVDLAHEGRLLVGNYLLRVPHTGEYLGQLLSDSLCYVGGSLQGSGWRNPPGPTITCVGRRIG